MSSESTQSTESHRQSRRRTQRTEIRRHILDATEALLVAKGYEGFSMRRLVDRCGYTAPTIYKHFGDKAGLIDTLLEERFRLMIARIEQVAETDDLVARLQAQLAAFVEFGLENPTHYSLLMAPRPDDMRPPPESVDRSRSQIQFTLTRLREQQRLQLDDIDEAIQCIWVMLHGLISARIARPDYGWTANQIEVSIDILLRGMLREPPANGPGLQPRGVR